MRAVVQRVSRGSVTIDGATISAIKTGLVVLLGITHDDTPERAKWLAEKIVGLRIFNDADGKMNRDLTEVGGAMLIVSQFTLYGDCRKGRRPSFDHAAGPEDANRLYEYFVAQARARNLQVETGIFQAHMEVEILNDGPVTLVIDSM